MLKLRDIRDEAAPKATSKHRAWFTLLIYAGWLRGSPKPALQERAAASRHKSEAARNLTQCHAPACILSSNKALVDLLLLLLKAPKVTLDHRQQWRGAGNRLCLRMKPGPCSRRTNSREGPPAPPPAVRTWSMNPNPTPYSPAAHRLRLRMERRQARLQRVRIVVLALHERLAGHVVHAGRARRRKPLMVRAPARRVDPAARHALHLRMHRIHGLLSVARQQHAGNA